MNTETLELKVGGTYRTRDGRKAEIWAHKPEDEFPWKGGIQDNFWVVTRWAQSGDYISGDTCEYDLISIWIDKPEVKDWSVFAVWHRWLAMDENGMWWSHESKPDRYGPCWGSSSKYRIPPDFYPTFSGDWKLSLIERACTQP